MQFSRIPANDYVNYNPLIELAETEALIPEAVKASQAAVDAMHTANAAIDYAAALGNSGSAEIVALIDEAMEAEPDTKTAAALLKSAERVRTAHLAALLRALRIPALKKSAQDAIRATAAALIPIYEADAAYYEEQANLAADVMNLPAECMQRTQMIRQHPERNAALRALSRARIDGCNFRTWTPEDDGALAAVKSQIVAMMK